jgi:hypothetical protein
MYDQHFRHIAGYESKVSFSYDFDLLARSLLRIAYNSARSAGSRHEHLRALAPFILHGVPRPENLAIFAELVSPVELPTGTDRIIRTITPEGVYRSAVGTLLTPHGDQALTRVVAVNSFYFHVVLPAPGTEPRNFVVAAAELAESIRGVVAVSHSTPAIELRSSPQNGITSLMPHVLGNADAYRAFFERKRPRDAR